MVGAAAWKSLSECLSWSTALVSGKFYSYFPMYSENIWPNIFKLSFNTTREPKLQSFL